MKLLKKLAVIASFSAFLTACVNSHSLNQEAANSYRQVVQQAKSKNVIDTSSSTAKRIHNVFNRMKPYAEKANKTGIPFKWEITVVRDNELNAWAMPGGKMMFYTGLVEKLQLNEDEIATVMGHEMAHALEEHTKSDRMLASVTGIATEISKIALESQGISTNVLGINVVDALADFGLNKPFSRSQETEADEVGLFLMAEAGYNPKSAPNVWKKMSQATGSSGSFLESIISTHPVNADRQANLERLLPKALEIYNNRK